MSTWNEEEDGGGHHGLAPPSRAQQRRNDAVEADIRDAVELAIILRGQGWLEHASLVQRLASRCGELLK